MLTDEMRSEYDRLYGSCVVNPERRADIEVVITRMMKSRERYQTVQLVVGVPWYVIAVIHNMECDGRFNCHLHNGDPLSSRTVQVPEGRPAAGNPPFTWEASAIDALRYEGFDVWRDWSIAGTLFKLEAYNGFGSRKHGIPTPYLWSGSQHYSRGKYVADHKFDPNAVSSEIGAAVLLSRMSFEHLIEFPLMRPMELASAAPATSAAPVVAAATENTKDPRP